jgi:hypothetical protein
MTTRLHADFTALRELETFIEQAERRAAMVPPMVLGSAAQGVFIDAVSNAASMADTGELSRSVQIERLTDGAYRVGAGVRQAFFLEYGSPNTGAPRPWLSAPAMTAQQRVLSEVSKAAALW